MTLKWFRPLWAVALILAAGAAASAAEPQKWQTQLTNQMLQQYDCKVAFFSEVAERTVNGDLVVLAKVHCEDKRTFNAYRNDSFKPFEIHPCEDPNTRVC